MGNYLKCFYNLGHKLLNKMKKLESQIKYGLNDHTFERNKDVDHR